MGEPPVEEGFLGFGSFRPPPSGSAERDAVKRQGLPGSMVVHVRWIIEAGQGHGSTCPPALRLVTVKVTESGPRAETLGRPVYSLLIVMLPLTVPMSMLAAPEPIVPRSLLRFWSVIVTGKAQETLPLTE